MSDPTTPTSHPEHSVNKPKRTARLGPTEFVEVERPVDDRHGLAAHAQAQARAAAGSAVVAKNGTGNSNEVSDDEDDGEDRGDYELEDGDTKVEDEDFLKDYPDDTEELHLQHLKLSNDTLPLLRFHRFGKSLRRLCLRQNNLVSPLPADAFEGLDALEELDLYDNRLGHHVRDEELKHCKNVESLDLSFNNIRHIPSLPSLTHVHTLYLVQNKISKIEKGALDWAKESLTSLELGGNRIRQIENIDACTLMQELWLGKNKIRKLEGLDTFVNLRILSIQSNRITKLEGLEALANLEELYISHNGLTKIEGLERNVNLTTLDVGNNFIEKIENLSHLTKLEEFWASYNKIPNLLDLDAELAPLPNLSTVYLEGNPCQQNEPTAYRRKIILAIPQIKQIDATFVKLS